MFLDDILTTARILFLEDVEMKPMQTVKILTFLIS